MFGAELSSLPKWCKSMPGVAVDSSPMLSSKIAGNGSN